MADDIGGLSVSFTAEASQLQGELRRLEERLRAFDRAHGQQRIRLQAQIDQPGQRAMLDFRREVSRGIAAQGAIRAKVNLAVPGRRELDQFNSTMGQSLKPIRVKVIGDFQWGQPPPTSVRVAGGGGGGAAPSVRAPMATQVSGTRVTSESREELQARREAARRSSRTAPATAPARRPTAVAPQLSANTARAAAQTQRVSNKGFFADWDDATIREELGLPQKQQTFAAKLREEAARRGLTAGPTGGARGFLGGTDPYLISQKAGQRRSMARANAARLAYAGTTGPDRVRLTPPSGESDEERVARLDQALYGRTRQRAGSGDRFRLLGPEAGGAADAVGGARGFADETARRRVESPLPHWSTGPQPPSSAKLRSMGRAGLLNQPGKDLYDPHAAPPEVSSRLTAKNKRVWNTIGSPAALPPMEKMVKRWEALAARVPDDMWKAQRTWLKDSGALIRDLSKGTGWSNIQSQGAAAELTNNASWPLTVKHFQEASTRWMNGARTMDEVFGKIGGPNSLAVAPRDRAKALAMMERPELTVEGVEKIIRSSAVTPKGKWTRPVEDVLAEPLPTKPADLTSAKIIQMFRGQMGMPSAMIPDRHVQRAIVGAELGRSHEGLSGPIQEAGRIAAGRRGMSPAEFMPPIWTMMGGGDPSFTADPFQMRARARGGAQAKASLTGGPNVAAFMPSTPRGLMRSPGEHIDPITGALTGAAIRQQGEMQARERTSPERTVLEQKQAWNRQQAAQQRMFARYSPGPGVGIAAFNGGLRDARGRFSSERQLEEASGVGAPGAPNWTQPQRAAPAAAQSPAAQAAIDLKGLSSAAREMMKELEAHPNLEQSFRQAVPDLFAEVDAAQQKANTAASAGAGAPVRSAQDIAMTRLNRITGGDSPDAERQRDFLEGSRARTREAAGVQQTLSLGRTIGSMAAGVMGGNRDRERISQIKRLESAYERVGRAGQESFDTVASAQVAMDRATIQKAPAEEIERLEKAYVGATEAAEPFRQKQAQIGADAEKLQGKISKPIAALRGSFAALSGALVGGFIYSAAVDGITAIAGALEKPVDAIGGYIGAANKLQTSLGQTTRSLNGHADLAVAATVAQSGLGVETAKAISPILEQRAAIQAGNEAFGEQVDMIRSASLFRAQTRAAQRGEAYGFGITPGALPGISGSTGGLFGSAIGGQMPLIEQLAQMTPQGTSGQRGAFAAAGGLGGALAGAATGATIGALGGPGGIVGGGLVGGAIGLLGGAGIGGAIGPELAGFSDIDLSRGTPRAAQVAALSPAAQIAARSPTGPSDAPATAADALAGLTDKQRDQIEGLGLAVDDLSEAAVRATPSLKGQVEATVAAGDAAAIAATADAMRGWVPVAEIDALRKSGFAVTGEGGKALGRTELQQWFQSGARGASIPTPEAAVAATAMPLAASLQMNQWTNQRQRDVMIPGQAYLQQLSTGRVGVGGERRGAPGIRDLPPEVAASAPNYEKGTAALSGLQQQMSATAQTGHSELITMLQKADSTMGSMTGSAGSLTGQFKTLETSLAGNGAAMRGLQLENMWAQAGLQVAQYDEQIRVANRSLQDAISFQSGAGSGQLGLLQHQARAYERQSAEIGFQQQALSLQSQSLGLQNSQLGIRSRELGFQTTQLQFQSRELGLQATQLSLMQRQRQINFQSALAGFVTPGATPEEIAARQTEAKLEAEFGQRQQDIAVEQFGIEKQAFDLEKQQLPIAEAQLGIDKQQVELQATQLGLAQQALGVSRAAFETQQAMIDVQAARAIQDLSNQLDLLTRARSVTLQVAVNNEAIAAYQAQIEQDMAGIQSVIQEAYNVQQSVMQNAASMAASYGGTLTKWNNLILGRLRDYLRGAENLLSGGFSGSAGGGGGGGAGMRSRAEAPGYLQNVSSPTQITVGEAGPETVAILRNPRSMTMAPQNGGSLPPVTVMVTGNNIGGSPADAEAFAAMIARKVEETMSRRSSLLGVRPN